MEQYICRACGKICEDWDDLAHHIDKLAKLKDGKHKRTFWVKSRIHKNAVKILNRPELKDFYNVPLTEGQLEAKYNSRRALSGQTPRVMTQCPKCKQKTPQLIEVEYIQSKQAVRNEQGILVVICDNCRR